MQRGGLCSTGVQENSSMQPDRIQVGWSVLVQLCFLDLGTGAPIWRGDLKSGRKGKEPIACSGRLALYSYFSIIFRRPGLQEYNPTGGFSLQSHGQNLIVRSLSPRDE
jgi:hypothetical protein